MSNVTTVVSAMPGTSGFTIAVFKADEMPVGSVVGLAAPPAASAALADSHNFEVCQHFNNWLIGQGLLLTNQTEESDGPMAPAMNWIASVQAAIAESSPKCELTDERIAAIWNALPGLEIYNKAASKGQDANYALHIAFARAIAAASGPNAGLVEALKMAIRQNECDMLMTGDELRKARAALAAAGIKEQP